MHLSGYYPEPEPEDPEGAEFAECERKGWGDFFVTCLAALALFLFILWLIAPGKARAAWGVGGCGPVGPMMPPAFVDPTFFPPAPGPLPSPAVVQASCGEIGWWTHDGEPLCKKHLYCGDRHVGCLDTASGWWQPDEGKGFQLICYPIGATVPAPPKKKDPKCGVCDAPCECGPCGCAARTRRAELAPPPADVPNFGILDPARIGSGGERCTLSGRPASYEECLKAVAAPSVVDDSGWLRLTVIGDWHEREKVKADVKKDPALAEWRDKLLVQTYRPDNWAVARGGFKTDGRPTIYLQDPDGKVYHRQDDYDDGPAGLAGAIRKADPNYDPKRDPDLRKPKKPEPTPDPTPAPAPSPEPEGPNIPGCCVGLLALLFATLAKRS